MAKNVTVIPAKKKNPGGRKNRSGKIRVAAYCRVSTEQEERLPLLKGTIKMLLAGGHLLLTVDISVAMGCQSMMPCLL